METRNAKLMVPVYDVEYAVIGRWHSREVKLQRTKRGNWKCSAGGEWFVFCKDTGRCINRQPKKWLVRLVERMRYKNIVSYVILEEP